MKHNKDMRFARFPQSDSLLLVEVRVASLGYTWATVLEGSVGARRVSRGNPAFTSSRERSRPGLQGTTPACRYLRSSLYGESRVFRVMWWLALAWAVQTAVLKAWNVFNVPDPGGIVSELIFYGVMYAVVANRARNHLGDAWSTLVPLRGVALDLLTPVLLTTIAGLVLSYQGLMLCYGLMPIHIMDPSAASPPDPAAVETLVTSLLSGAVIPAVFEEAMTRGLVLHALAANMSKRRAIVISAVFFAAMHGAIERTPGTFIGGLLYGWMYVRTGSLLPGMIAHALHNAVVEVLWRAGALPGGARSWIGVDEYSLLPTWLVCAAIAAAIVGAIMIRKTSVWPEDPSWKSPEEIDEQEYYDRAA